MRINYKSQKLMKLCTDFRVAKKKFGSSVAEKLFSAIDFIEASENLVDVRNYKPFRFHNLTGDKKGRYSIYLGRRLGYRLLVVPLLNGVEATSEEVFGLKAVEIKIIRIETSYEKSR